MTNERMGLHILITGNPVDGFSYFGPFATGDEAATYGDGIMDGDWWIAPLAAHTTADIETEA